MERTPSPSIARQISLIAPGLYPLWSPVWNKWMIVKDSPRKVPGVTDYDPVSGKNYVIELVLEDEGGQAIELDSRIIETLYKAMREKEKFYGPDGFSVDKFCDAMDEVERIRILRARKFRDEATAEFFKTLWKNETRILFT